MKKLNKFYDDYIRTLLEYIVATIICALGLAGWAIFSAFALLMMWSPLIILVLAILYIFENFM